MSLLFRLIINAGALLLVAYFLPGVHVSSLTGAFLSAAILGLANAVIKPILTVITLPLVLLTLGLFTLVINAITFYIVAHLGFGLTVDGFGSAFLGALILSAISYVLSSVAGVREKA